MQHLLKEGGKGFSMTCELPSFSRETWNQKFNSREFVIKGISVTRELANYFSMKREIKNLIHVNRDQQLFRDSWTWWLFFRETVGWGGGGTGPLVTIF